ncbi:MAG: hypothetical protein EHM35_00450 [Planctomycetaceae bacterium]|nr:MAG: hypothetical protein EHM35_00450 [Planctomycetaceae bacterium]
MVLTEGQEVTLELTVFGITTTEPRKVLTVDMAGIWLDNGPGNRPSGPYNTTTGQWRDNGVIVGSRQRVIL